MQQEWWHELEAKIGQSKAWEYHSALSGVIAHYTESFEPEDSLKSLLKSHPINTVETIFILKQITCVHVYT